MNNDDMSNCCGAYIIGDGDEGLCSDCKESCVSVKKEKEEERKEMNNRAIKNLNKLQDMILSIYLYK